MTGVSKVGDLKEFQRGRRQVRDLPRIGGQRPYETCRASEVKEFVQFLATAKGSAGEVRCQLYVAADQGYLEEGDFIELNALAAETGNMVGGLMKYLRGSGYKGTKFKALAKK